MRTLPTLITVLAFFMGATSCCAAGESAAQVTETKAVVLQQGESIRLTLEGNPTTGYLWEVQDNGAPAVSLGEGLHYRPGSDLIGSGGFYELTITGREKGTAIIILIYRRPWEKTAPPARECRVVVTIR